MATVFFLVFFLKIEFISEFRMIILAFGNMFVKNPETNAKEKHNSCLKPKSEWKSVF